MILESAFEGNPSHPLLKSGKHTYVDTRNPKMHADIAIALLENIKNELGIIPEQKLKRYVSWLVNVKLPQVILEIHKIGAQHETK